MAEVPDNAYDAIEGLGPSPQWPEIYEATIGFPTLEVAACAVEWALEPSDGGGGGGGGGPPWASGFRGLVASTHPSNFGTAVPLYAALCRGERVVIAEAGTLRDLSAYFIATSGNVEVAIYSTEPTRAQLWTSGSVPCPASGAWSVVGDPQLAVAAGATLDLVIGADDDNSGIAGLTPYATGMNRLPDGFVPGDGADPFLGWYATIPFPPPATIDPATVAVEAIPGLIARLEPA